MYSIKALIHTTACSLFICTTAFSQDSQMGSAPQDKYWSPIIVGLPALSVSPDARSTGMGNVAVATNADAFGICHNMSKMGFISNTWGISLSYTPWMPDLFKDMNISYLSGYYSFEDATGLRHTLSGSLRYFNIGKAITFPNGVANPVPVHPYEFGADIGYALRMHPYWSAGVALRYGVSDYNFSVNQVTSKAQTILCDLSLTYRAPVNIANHNAMVQAAIATNNIGGKLTHDDGKTYLFSPAVFRVGVGVDTQISSIHQLGVYTEATKLMVPIFPIGTGGQKDKEKYYSQSILKALFGSWGDNPRGFIGELKEMSFAMGAEYTYAERLTARVGYHFQNAMSGTNGGLSMGAGIVYEFVKFDVSYFLADRPNSPLNNTLRLTVTLSF